MRTTLIINFLLFQLGWFACVLGGAYDQTLLACLVATLIIAYHLYRAADAMQELRLLIFALIIGLVFESIITAQGFARYYHGQHFDVIAPVWMILMWPLFATTLNLSMRWLKTLAPLLIALIGALLVPLAYYAGNRLGAVVYDDLVVSMSLIAIAWALLLPAMVTMSSRFDGYGLSASSSVKQEYAHHV